MPQQTFTDIQPIKQTFTDVTPINGPQPSSSWDRLKDSFLSAIGHMSDEDAKNFFQHPINTLMQSMNAQGDLAKQAKAAFDRGDYQEAVRHGINYMIPFTGQVTDKAGTQLQQGDIAGGIGSTLGAAAPLIGASPEVRTIPGKVLGEPIKKAALLGRSPAEAYQSALKPSTTLGEGERSAIVSTGLNEKIPVSQGGLSKLSDLIDNLNQKVKATIEADPNRPINASAVAERTAGLKERFANQVNPEADLQAIEASKKEFLRNNPGDIPAAQAQSMKTGTYAQLSSKAYGEMQTASVEAQKSLARGLKEELAQQFPELSGLNAREGALLDLQPVLERAVNRISNHQMLGIGTPITAGAAKAITGSGKVAAVAATMKAVLDNPYVKSRLAIALSKGGKLPMPVAMSRVAAYSASLGAASSVAENSDQGNQQ